MTSSEASIVINVGRYLLILAFLAALSIEARNTFKHYLVHEKEIRKMELDACIKMNCLKPMPTFGGKR